MNTAFGTMMKQPTGTPIDNQGCQIDRNVLKSFFVISFMMISSYM